MEGSNQNDNNKEEDSKDDVMSKQEVMEFFKLFLFMSEEEIKQLVEGSEGLWYVSSVIQALEEVEKVDYESSRLREWLNCRKSSSSSTSSEESDTDRLLMVKEEYVSQLRDTLVAEAIKRKNSGPKKAPGVIDTSSVIDAPLERCSSEVFVISENVVVEEELDRVSSPSPVCSPVTKKSDLSMDEAMTKERKNQKLSSPSSASSGKSKSKRRVNGTRNRGNGKVVSASKNETSMSSSPPHEDLSSIDCPWMKRLSKCPIEEKQGTCPFGGHNRRRSMGK
jgi:hypothetical protein